MSQGVPKYGVWNVPNAENLGFTGNFDVARKVRHDRSSMDHIPIQRTIDTNSDPGIGERLRNVKSPVGYDKSEIWETESAKSNPENVVPQNRQSRRPPASIERRRHDLSPVKHQKVLASQDYPKGRYERPRTGTSSGSDSFLGYLPPENRHHRRPSSSSDSSRRDLLSSREEEFMAKKGHTAPKFGKWNVNPNCTQEYTMEFAVVRNQKENFVESSTNTTPQTQQSYYTDTPQQKKHKGTKVRDDDDRSSGGSSPESTGSVEMSISSHSGGMNYPSLFSSLPSGYGVSQQSDQRLSGSGSRFGSMDSPISPAREEPPSYLQRYESFENPMAGRGAQTSNCETAEVVFTM